MTDYTVRRTRGADKALAAIEKRERARIEAAVALLGRTPRPPRAKKLVGAGDRWRVRVGDYRISYEIREGELVILVIRNAHHREVYR